MALSKYIPVLIIVGLLCTAISGSIYTLKTTAHNEDSTLPVRRTKRSLTTICVEIKPSGPQEEPYYMCKGTELPTVAQVTSGSFRPTTPSYAAADAQFNAPSAANNMQQQAIKMKAYEQQKTTTTSSSNSGTNQHIPGYGGFRGPTAAAANQQQTSKSPAADNKQQFFLQTSQFHSQLQQHKHEQQQQQQKSSHTQPVASYGLSTHNNNSQQPASFAPPSASYGSESATAQTQPVYAAASTGGASFGRPQPTSASISISAGGAAYGSAAESYGTNRPSGSSGSYGQSVFAESLPVASAATASYGPTIPYAHAAVSAPVEAKHGFAQAAPVAGFVVPAAKATQHTNLKTNMAQSTYDVSDQSQGKQLSFDAKPHSYQQPNVDPMQNQANAAALSYQPTTFATKNPKTEVPSLADYRAMLDEDIFRSPIWGFSPDEFSSFRSVSEVDVPTQNMHQPALPQPRSIPAEYHDDPIMRQFYSSLHEPSFEDQLVGAQYAQPPAYIPKAPNAAAVNKRPKAIAAAPATFYDAPRAPPAPVVYSQPICSAAAPAPPPRQQPLQRCAADAMPGASYQPPLPLAMSMPCAACNRADYNNFQPVFIALPCYGQPNGYGNLNAAGRASFFNLGMQSPQPAYTNMMNPYLLDTQRESTQYDREMPGLFSGFEAAANPFAGSRTAFPMFGMPYVAPNLGSAYPFGFFNGPQHQMAQVANVERVSPPMTSHTNNGDQHIDMEGDQLLGSVQTATDNKDELSEKVSTIAADAAVSSTLTTEATTAGIETKSTTNGSTDRLVGAEAEPSTEMGAGSTSAVAATVGDEKQTTFKQLITLAKAAKNINQDEFPDPSETQTLAQPVTNNAAAEQRKGKRHNMRMQSAAGVPYSRQQYLQNAQ